MAVSSLPLVAATGNNLFCQLSHRKERTHMQIQREELIQRTERMRSVMHENNLDALIIYSDEYRSGNGTYFTNYKPINLIEESPQMLCLIGDLPPTLFIGRLNAYSAVKTYG
ncbi:MAG: hypothetical protein CM1200mP41_02240 [Gammaproteobacteria bacterium]|nr:MAG: hypothetical protein CM1200mP41_02240 [Gammaproteobacteria bacterium]